VTPIRSVACMIVATLGFVATAADAVERTYFIAAEEVVWDFAPSDPNNPITGEPFTKEESVFLRHAKDRIGRKYLKAVYREYTDPSFTTLKPQGPAEQSLGIMGPTIHAEVGDTIAVEFRNNTRFPIGIHLHGVLYAKASEGAHYVTDAAPAGQEHDHRNLPETGANVEPKGQYTYSPGHAAREKHRESDIDRKAEWRLKPPERFAVTHPRWEPCAGIPLARIWAGAVSNDRPYRASSRAFLKLTATRSPGWSP
jgi:Multicopper oxidase